VKDSSYHLLIRVMDALIWGGELLGEENLPVEGPAVFIANHLGPLGPIGSICSIPFRLYPWVVGEMIDPVLAPDYIRIDFVEPRLKLSPPFSHIFSKALTKITIPMFKSIEGIPVYYLRRKELLYETLEKSLTKLKERKFLLVFPEYAILGSDSMKKIYPFQKTVFRLGEMYYSATRHKLSFYPVAIHESHKIKIGAPFKFSPLTQPVKERLRLKRLLESAVNQQYLEMDSDNPPERMMTPRTN
jgi:1-acyl-sn-glycerol-3-phosphate acyltransferase